MRVGADSALGVRYMAREDARVLGILGSGGMARAHVAAIAAVRRLERIQIFSPTGQNREEFAREMAEMHGVSAVAVATPEEAYTGADIISSCASAIGPVIFGEHLTPGMHVTCIGGTLDAVANAKVDKALPFGLAPAPSELPHLHFEDECLTFAIEDQVSPKRCGHVAGKTVIETDEMVGKIRSVVAARSTDAFMIIARTDAIAVEGIEGAVKRAKAYEAAGADAIFPDAVRGREDIEQIVAAVKIPVRINA